MSSSVVMERSHEGPEHRTGLTRSGNGAVECARVMAAVWTFLFGECIDEVRACVCKHLEACENCLRDYTLEARFKSVIATRCGGDEAPKRLRWKR